jgi:hypothetical protein
MFSTSARKCKLASTNKKSKDTPIVASTAATAIAVFPVHTFGRGAISTASNYNLSRGGGSWFGADALG